MIREIIMNIKIQYPRNTNNQSAGLGFTLIELLIVVAIIALLLAILVPALNGVKRIARSVYCQGNLRQIAIGWNMYLDENREYFYQGVNVNHSFGGWKGISGYSSYRPLNKQLNLPTSNITEVNVKVFLCPSDCGGIFNKSPELKAFQYFGNSYQTNIFMIGPNQVGVPNDERQNLHELINNRLKGIKRSSVSQPDRLLLVGDNGWMNQWDPAKPEMPSWHDKRYHHNLAFLDGRVDFLRIRKGLYINPREDYRVLPFEELDKMAYEVQEEVIPPEE